MAGSFSAGEIAFALRATTYFFLKETEKELLFADETDALSNVGATTTNAA